jgi:hypothetical protein
MNVYGEVGYGNAKEKATDWRGSNI